MPDRIQNINHALWSLATGRNFANNSTKNRAGSQTHKKRATNGLTLVTEHWSESCCHGRCSSDLLLIVVGAGQRTIFHHSLTSPKFAQLAHTWLGDLLRVRMHSAYPASLQVLLFRITAAKSIH